MTKKHPVRKYIIRQALLVFAHIIALGVFLAGVSLIMLNDNYKKGFSWMNQEIFEESPAFAELVDADIDSAFMYYQYRDVLETEGKLDSSKLLFTIKTGPYTEKYYTIEDVLSLAKERGYYLNSDYTFLKAPGTEIDRSKDDVLGVIWEKADGSVNGNIDEYMTIDEAIQISINNISGFYKAKERFFGKNNHNFYFSFSWDGEIFTNEKNLTEKNAKAGSFGKYIIVKKNNPSIITNLSTGGSSLEYIASNVFKDAYEYEVIVTIDTDYPVNDIYTEAKEKYTTQRDLYFYGIVATIVGGILMLITLLAIARMTGRYNPPSEEITLSGFDKRSVEGRFVIMAFIAMILLFLMDKFGVKLLYAYVTEAIEPHAEKLAKYLIIYMCTSIFVFSVIRSIKAGNLWESSLAKRITDSIKKYFEKEKYTVGFTITFIVYLILNVALICSATYLIIHEQTLVQKFIIIGIIVVFVVLNFYAFYEVYKKTREIDKINQAVANIAGGDTGYKLDTEFFSNKEQGIAYHINNISSGFEMAMNDSIKSERMKADLITNVSHDIKTPLTSIINYIDLLKRENLDNPKAKEYLEVLENKSQYLKTLTEDLIEASKVTTGNISLNIQEIDFAELANQSNGEFDEKFKARNLEIISNIPEHPVIIMADGSHLWRVFENIYNNALKYASEGSRVYVDMTETDDKAAFTIKNVSANRLNISPDELTERFVRGESSRTTEGHGLGLSIAESLTKLQGGHFGISIDGDLFKATIEFEKK